MQEQTKDVDRFIDFLEGKKLKKINPKAFTLKEIVFFAKMQGFNFSQKDFETKIKELQDTPEDQLNSVGKTWKQSMDKIEQ